MKHTLHHNILGEIDYEGELWRWTFAYSLHGQDERLVVDDVVKMQAMKTGCYVLFLNDGRIINVPPGYKFVIEERRS